MSVNHLTSFKTLFQELYPGMVKIALFYVHDLAIAEDITQEIFTRLWERREKLDMIDNLKGYLSNAIKNRCLNYLEHQQVVNKYQQEYLEELAKDDYIEEFIQKVQISLEKLPPKRRQILEMSIVEAKSYQEIADQEGISPKTISKKPTLSYVKTFTGMFRILFCLLLFKLKVRKRKTEHSFFRFFHSNVFKKLLFIINRLTKPYYSD